MAFNKKEMEKIFNTTSNQDDDEIDENYLLSQALDGDDNSPAVIINTDASEFSPQDLNTDADYARRTLHDLTTQAQKLVSVSIENAENGNARDVEVAATALSAAVNSTEKLIDLHKKIADIKGSSKVNNNTYVENQTINISTSDLLNELLSNKEKTIDV